MFRLARRFIRRRFTQPKPLAIHVEALHLAEVREAFYPFLERQNPKPTLYCITPVNKAYVEGFFGPVGDGFGRKLQNAYRHLYHDLGYHLQLHVHLTRVPNKLPISVKEQMINDAYAWLHAISGKPEELVLGWFAEEEGVDRIAYYLGLKVGGMTEHLRAFKVIHDFNLIGAK